MIDYPTFCRLRQLHDERGLKASPIAAELHLDPKTVEKWVDQPTYQPRQGTQRPSKLDAFKGQIVALLERHPYTAQQLLQQLRTQGYAGGYSILKEFVREVRPVRKPAYLMLEFAPGECAQVDWGSFGSVSVGSTRRRLSFFVRVLCYSRLLYLEFTLSEGREQFLACHRPAFEFFGGVTEKVMIDNLKVGVLRHPLGEPALFHPRYLDLAAHYGFRPVACQVRKGNEKGRVESGVGYVKKNFLNGLDIPSFAAVHPAATLWRDTVANVRVHGETHRQPSDLFAQEKPRLRPLPAMPYDGAVVRPIGANGCCHVLYDNPRHPIQKIVALSEIHGPENVSRALQDALTFEAYGCEYIANLLEQRQRQATPPAALHLTRRQDLLDLELPEPDLGLYDPASLRPAATSPNTLPPVAPGPAAAETDPGEDHEHQQEHDGNAG